MTDSLTKDQGFNDIEALDMPGMEASLVDGMNCKLVYLAAENYLDVSEARALRDWLNKVLPKDVCKPGEHSYQDAPICVHCGDRP